MFKCFFHILIFASSGKYQNIEKPLKRQRKFGLLSCETEIFAFLNCGDIRVHASQGCKEESLSNNIWISCRRPLFDPNSKYTNVE